MKLSNRVEALLKENYKGTIIKIESDTNIFFIIKRILKKNIIHNSLSEHTKNVKILINNILFLNNIFDIETIREVFLEILDPLEYTHLSTVCVYLKLYEADIDEDFLKVVIEGSK